MFCLLIQSEDQVGFYLKRKNQEHKTVSALLRDSQASAGWYHYCYYLQFILLNHCFNGNFLFGHSFVDNCHLQQSGDFCSNYHGDQINFRHYDPIGDKTVFRPCWPCKYINIYQENARIDEISVHDFFCLDNFNRRNKYLKQELFYYVISYTVDTLEFMKSTAPDLEYVSYLRKTILFTLLTIKYKACFLFLVPFVL